MLDVMEVRSLRNGVDDYEYYELPLKCMSIIELDYFGTKTVMTSKFVAGAFGVTR